MSTHGDLLIIDRDDQNSRQWLHAYSNGHPEELVDWLIDLPAWLASRALLSYEMARPLTEDDADDQGRSYANGIGPGWWIEHILEFGIGCYDRFLSLDSGAWSCNLSNWVASRHVGRWCPMPEENAPWHTVGEPPDVKVICKGDSYRIFPSAECELGFVHRDVPWKKALRRELKMRAGGG